MLKRRLWVVKGPDTATTLGALGEESQLDMMERALFFDATNRKGEDTEILNPLSQLYSVAIACGPGIGGTDYMFTQPLFQSEILDICKEALWDDLPEDLLTLLSILPTSPEGFFWGQFGTSVQVTSLGPANWNTL